MARCSFLAKLIASPGKREILRTLIECSNAKFQALAQSQRNLGGANGIIYLSIFRLLTMAETAIDLGSHPETRFDPSCSPVQQAKAHNRSEPSTSDPAEQWTCQPPVRKRTVARLLPFVPTRLDSFQVLPAGGEPAMPNQSPIQSASRIGFAAGPSRSGRSSPEDRQTSCLTVVLPNGSWAEQLLRAE